MTVLITGNHESIIGPSDRDNTINYLNQSRTSTQLQIDINIPIGQIVTDSETLNIIYNRFGNDLIFWSPRKDEDTNDDNGKETVGSRKWSLSGNNQPSYFMCKSGIKLSDSIESDSSFHSIEGTIGHDFINRSVICVNVQEIFFDCIGSSGSNESSGSKVNSFTERISGQKVLFGAVIGSDHEKKNTIFLNSQNVNLTKINSVIKSVINPVINSTINKELIIENNYLKEVISNLDMTFDIVKESKELKRIKVSIGLSNALLHSVNNNQVNPVPSVPSNTLDHFKFIWSLINVTDEVILGFLDTSVARKTMHGKTWM